jgi:methanogenic corrinoid protein MtbC1
VACVEAELHDLGARIAADFLEMAGFEVRFLGANVPTAGLVELVHRRPPDLLALSASTTATLAALRRAIVAVRGIAGDRVPVLVGGRVFAHRPELPGQLGAAQGGDALDAVAVARRLLGK